MRVVFETEQEAEIFKNRFHAVAYTLGPMVELTAVLPDGKILHKTPGGMSPAARCASLNEKIQNLLDKIET